MAQKKSIEFQCPKCKSIVQDTYIQSVNADIDPQLIDRILDLRLNIASCSACDQKLFIDDFFVYNDPKKRLIVIKYPLSDLDSWEKILKNNQEQWAGLPAKLKVAEIQPKVVFGPFSLKEKILLAKDGLDEGPVEIYKIGLMGQMGEKFFNKKHRLLYFNTEQDYLHFVLVDVQESKEVNLVKVPVETFEAFCNKNFEELIEKELVRHILEPPFVSMEKLFFSSGLVNDFLH